MRSFKFKFYKNLVIIFNILSNDLFIFCKIFSAIYLRYAEYYNLIYRAINYGKIKNFGTSYLLNSLTSGMNIFTDFCEYTIDETSFFNCPSYEL